jgi:hypothetical protein
MRESVFPLAYEKLENSVDRGMIFASLSGWLIGLTELDDA